MRVDGDAGAFRRSNLRPALQNHMVDSCFLKAMRSGQTSDARTDHNNAERGILAWHCSALGGEWDYLITDCTATFLE